MNDSLLFNVNFKREEEFDAIFEFKKLFNPPKYIFDAIQYKIYTLVYPRQTSKLYWWKVYYQYIIEIIKEQIYYNDYRKCYRIKQRMEYIWKDEDLKISLMKR